MPNVTVAQQAAGAERPARLHYIDWLRVMAVLGVFLFHATNVFNDYDFPIKNAEQSATITFFDAFFLPWGMPLFFVIAGAGAWFALQRRTPRQYARERAGRLLVPFFVGSILLTPLERYLEWSHRVHTGLVQGSFLDLIKGQSWGPDPRIFAAFAYHLWFLGFLLCFSLLTLPLFRWLNAQAGQRLVSRLARVCERRAGLLVFILPLLVVRLGLQPFFPEMHHWTDFVFLLCFFILGFVLFADRRFTQALRRDWPITLGIGLAAFAGAAAISLVTQTFPIEAAPRTLLDFVWWSLMVMCGWCWTAFVLYLGMRYMDVDSQVLQYGKGALLPFFVVHLLMVFLVAYFVVQLEAGLVPKLLAVVVGAFALSLGLFELLIKRVGVLRAAFGMKAG